MKTHQLKTNISSSSKQSNVITCATASLLMLLSGVAIGQDAKAPAEPAKIANDDPAQAILLQKLNAIIIPVVDFKDVSLEDAVDFLGAISRKLNVAEKDITKREFKFVINPAPQKDGAEAPQKPMINRLRLRNVSLLSAIKYTCLLTNMSFSVEKSIVITPKKEGDKELALPVDQAAKAVIENRLNTLMFPKIDVEDISIDDALDFLRSKTLAGDTHRKGVNFVLVNPLEKEVPRIDKIKLENVSLATFLKEICEATNLDYTVDDAAVVLIPKKQ